MANADVHHAHQRRQRDAHRRAHPHVRAWDSLPRIATLLAGRTVGPFAVGMLHSAPWVSVNAQGQQLIANPVEGFSGFNPALAAGSYTVKLRITTGIIDVRVAATP